VADPARRDIANALKRSLGEFGFDAAIRYRALIRQALLDIAADHERPGSTAGPELMAEGARTFHISLSRGGVAAPVREPRHFVLHRYAPDGVIEVARILHDSCELARHLPASYGRTSCSSQ
jgi:toxin ParE1/3/4